MQEAQTNAPLSGRGLFSLLVNVMLRHGKVWEGWRDRDVEKHCYLWQAGRRGSSGIFGIHSLYARVNKK